MRATTRRAEEISRIESISKAVIDALPAQIAVLDEAGVIVAMNRAWTSAVECKGNPRLADGTFGTEYVEALRRDPEVSDIADGLARVLAGSVDQFRIEYACEDAQHVRKWFVMVATSTRAHQKKWFGMRVRSSEPRYIVVAHSDISDQKRAAEAEGHLADLVRASPDGIFARDLEGTITNWNPAAERILGYTAAEVIGRNSRELVPEDRMIEYEGLMDALRLGVSITVNTVRLAKDGHPVRVSLSIAPQRDVTGNVTAGVGILRDITQAQAMEKQLEEAERLSSLGRLAATMAHEFNNVLMGIQPFADLLGRSATEPRQKKAVDQIKSSIQRGKRVTDEILSFTRGAPADLRSVDVREWLEHITPELHALLPASIRLEVYIASDTGALLGETSKLSQVITNLILNARDAMSGDGTITISAFTSKASAIVAFGALPAADRYVHITVSDTGAGIDAKHLPHIFEPLFTTKQRGTGLGLSVVYKIVKSHAGEIFVESVAGKGTQFHIFIPQLAEGATAAAPQPPRFVTAHACRKVMLVEDDTAISAGLSVELEAYGHAVAVLNRGLTVIPTIEKARPDVVVLDIDLPDVNGATVYRLIRERWADLPVIFSTAHAARADVMREKDKHVAFLTKPYETSRLLETISRLTTPAA